GVRFEDIGQILLLLFLRTKGINHRAHHRDSKGDGLGGALQGQFVRKNTLFSQTPTRASVLNWPSRGYPPLAIKVLLPINVFVLFQLFSIKNFALNALGQMRLSKFAYFLAKGLLLWADIKIHRHSSCFFK